MFGECDANHPEKLSTDEVAESLDELIELGLVQTRENNGNKEYRIAPADDFQITSIQGFGFDDKVIH